MRQYRNLLILIAIVWLWAAVLLVVRGIHQQGFDNYADSGNVSGAVISIVLPGAFIAVWHHRAQRGLHEVTRAHNDQLHKETREHAARLHAETRKEGKKR